MHIFLELSLIVVVATCISFLMRFLRQPLVVGYILSGILLGPYFFNTVHSFEQIEIFSKIGISILLFIVGLSLSPHVMKEVGKVSLVAGIGQVFFTFFAGFAVCLFLGLSKASAAFVAISITFSSTIIILKLLSDKGDVNKLYGQIALGLLLVQDIVATLVLVLIGTLGAQDSGMFMGGHIFLLFVKGLLLAFFLYVLSLKVVSRFARFIASSQELLFMFSLAWGFGIASLFTAIGFSIEIGALVAGVTLAVSPFAYEISSRLKPLRDFFVFLFFILLGAGLTVTNTSELISSGIILSVFILIGNPLIVFLLMHWLRFKPKTAFQTGLTMAQISEFSLILMALGRSLGLVSDEVMSLVTVVGMITIAGSSYLIMYSDVIYQKLEKIILFFFKSRHRNRVEKDFEQSFDIVLFGFGRVGMDFVRIFEKLKKTFLVVDFNPHTLKDLKARNIPHRFGDAEDVEFLEELNLKKTSLIVSTVPDFDTNMLLLHYSRSKNSKSIVVLLSHDAKDADKLYEAGASYVVMPHYLGARHAGEIIKKAVFNEKSYETHKARHLLAIKTRYFI